jgi:hypothetical protein
MVVMFIYRGITLMLVHVETQLGCYGICMRYIFWYMVHAWYGTCFGTLLMHGMVPILVHV